MNWSHLIGQELIKKKMEYLLSSNQVPHAQLFSGSPGYGVLPLVIEFSLMLLNHKSDSDSANGLGKVSQNPDLHFVFPVVKRGSEKIVYSHDYAKEWSTFLNESPYGDYSNWFELISVGNKQGIIAVSNTHLTLPTILLV